jgi:hypothetical protein
MIKRPVAIILGLTLLFGGLAKCNAFSAEGKPVSDPRILKALGKETVDFDEMALFKNFIILMRDYS